VVKNDVVLLETRLGPGEASTFEEARALELEGTGKYTLIVEADMGVHPEVVSCGPLVLEIHPSNDGRVFDRSLPCILYEMPFRQVKKAWKVHLQIGCVRMHNFIKPVIRNAPANHTVSVKVTARCR
jgi:hypothetical protein